MWKPTSKVTSKFPAQYKRCALTLLASLRRDECPLSVLPNEVMFYIINMCSWDWFGGVEEMIEAKKLKLGYGTNASDQYGNQRDGGGEGIGWRSRGTDYRRLIHQHMMESQTGRRYMDNRYAHEEENDEDDDYYVEESSDDEMDDDGEEEQGNFSRILQYVVQRAGNGNSEQRNGLSPEQIQALLARIVASAENENGEDLEIDEDDVEEVVE